MNAILEIIDISKMYRIRHESEPYQTFRESIINLLKFKRTISTEEFWALKNISFSVEAGESIGIIGKNGAGKSTLLKILSKITPPTDGKIIGRGRVASLLEVGTGFHPELSGRENIFLNGSILGMRRKEIQNKFDAIVDFSGVEKFLDTPLKHYSSGMQLRLAFSVAAFLDPEILIIDEVLAVGDAEFQKKCIGQMESVTKSGRTILFVSHQMGLVNQLCNRAILLEKGKMIMNDSTELVTAKYLSLRENEADNRFVADPVKSSLKDFFISEALTVDEANKPAEVFGFHQPIGIRIQVQANKILQDEILSVALLDKFGNRVVTIHKSIKELNINDNLYSGTMRIPGQLIAPNFYSFHFAVVKSDGTIFDIHEGQCRMQVADTGTPFSQYEGKNYGSIIINCDWQTD
ncbi:MAG: ATP-binding cassette domain-containing protein [Bacteroidetes bacterium]|nr:MAG: ATP-binding cassette domain-containing protein [Bacteroidota bacterium]